MTKLNGINSLGSVVNFHGEASIITDAHTSNWNGSEYHSYTVSPINGNTEYGGITESSFTVLTHKTPLKKYLTKLASIEKKTDKINQKASEEMAKISKKRGWDNLAYDGYDNDYEMIFDGMSAGMGLDELYDEKYELMQLMIETARKVKKEVVA